MTLAQKLLAAARAEQAAYRSFVEARTALEAAWREWRANEGAESSAAEVVALDAALIAKEKRP